VGGQPVDDPSVFAAATSERLDIAELLESLDQGRLASPSLCNGWDIFTVGAHLAVTVSASFAGFMAAVIRQGGNVHRANDRLARKMARRPPAEVIEILRLSADLRLSPPRSGTLAALTDVLVHAGDIRRPLDLPHNPPADRVFAALGFLTGARSIGLVRRHPLEGLRLVADDVGFVSGSGEVVAGRGADLMMAVCGRQSVLPKLHGPGVAALRSRVPAGRLRH
jgi:uncharacterized protein (TIGR03083 family)